MNQILHIFRKDVRFLRWEIVLLLVLAATLAFSPVEGLFEIGALFVTARLIHAESIPGDRQFWLTRPYKPMSLLGAKLLFIVVFLCLPIGLAQTAMVLRLGFPLAQELPGLIWTQILIFFLAALPVAALASVTSGLVPFVAAALVLIATALYGRSTLAILPPARISLEPLPSDWIRLLPFSLAIAGIAITVLLWQYRDRRTLFSIVFGLIVYYSSLILFLLLPSSVSSEPQTWLSRKPELAVPIRVEVKPDRRLDTSSVGSNIVRVPVPLVVTGIPDGMALHADDMSVSLEWPGERWKPEAKPGLSAHVSSPTEAVLSTLLQFDSAVYRRNRALPAMLRGTVYLTLFGEPERRHIRLNNGPVNVQDGLQCYTGEYIGGSYLLCRSFFGWPSRIVSAETRNAVNKTEITDFGASMISYSPFPARLDLDPLEVRWGEPVLANDATIVTKRPLAHFRRDFELPGLVLADFENRPKAPLPWQVAR